MSGKRYQIFMAPSAHRRYKKFEPLLKKKIKKEANTLSEDPHRYEELKGPLRGIDLKIMILGRLETFAF